jgi:hypothetical protein
VPAGREFIAKFDHLPQRLRADLAAQAHPRPTAKHNLDDAVAISASWAITTAAISTGTIALLSTAASGNSCRRHWNSWLLFTSWRRGTIDTDAPGTCVSATIWRFNASEYCRRFGCLVSTKPVWTLVLLAPPSADHCANPPSAAGALH